MNYNFILCPKSLRSLVSEKTKAVVTVNLNGRNSISDELLKIISEYSIPLIQDNAQSLLSSVPNKINNVNTIQAYSFSIAKLLTTGQGGCVITDNKHLAYKVQKIRTQGLGNILRPDNWEIGSNYRISDLLSSIGLSQLKLINNKQKKLLEIYTKYKNSLIGFDFCKEIPVLTNNGEYPLYSEFLFESRDKLMNYLDSNGIESRPFFKDLNTAKYINCIEFPETIFSKEGLTLPGGDGLSEENQDLVISKILEFYRSNY